MKEKVRRTPRHFDSQFKLGVLVEYYASGSSMRAISHKYALSDSSIRSWLRIYDAESLSLSSDPSEPKRQTSMARGKESMNRRPSSAPMSEEELLREEVARLRKALAYSELRNEALNEVLKIGREQYGIDLLKKAGAKQ